MDINKNGHTIYIMETLVIRGNKKNPDAKYQCLNCDYYTSHKGDWTKHLLTAKHKKICGYAKKTRNPKKTHKCNLCGKIFKSRSGKWKHEKNAMEILIVQ